MRSAPLSGTWQAFGRLPQGFHLIQGEVRDCPPLATGSSFDVRESLEKAPIGLSQDCLCVQVVPARQVDQGEEQISQLPPARLVIWG
jgi:hypothetical protein